MASRGENFDVFLMVADTVYKGVPYHVVCGWVEQGRANADDKLRPAGGSDVDRAFDYGAVATAGGTASGCSADNPGRRADDGDFRE